MADRTLWTNAVPGGNVLVVGSNVHNFLAGAAITRGQVVAIHGTGDNFTVWPCILGTTLTPLGIAINSAASGAKVAVAGLGCIVYCQQETDDTDATAGAQVTITDSAGFVGAVSGTANLFLVGVRLEPSVGAGDTYERILVLCGLTTSVHA